MGNIQSQFISVEGATIHYLEAGKENKSSVLFLHGASFKAQTWQDNGTLNIVAEKGYRAIALDLPGYGDSESLSMAGDKFLLILLERLNIDFPIIVSPSMSGGYSLPFVANYSHKLTGFVAIAPVAISQYAQQLKGVKLPTLAIWGSNDRIVPIKMADKLIELMPSASKVILTNAGHACYLKATDEFHHHLIKFMDSIYN
jgi:pimeloyl-ACP methyl ester carboxylesterase